MTESTAAGSRPEEGAAAAEDPTVRPFHVEVPQEELDDLRRRIAAARWPSRELVTDRSQGVQLATLQALARYWATDYDLRRIEARLNALPQFTTEIDGVDIHFLHVKSPHPDALPLLITHGWPGSVIELLEVVGPLTDPTAHGGAATSPPGKNRCCSPRRSERRSDHSGSRHGGGGTQLVRAVRLHFTRRAEWSKPRITPPLAP